MVARRALHQSPPTSCVSRAAVPMAPASPHLLGAKSLPVSASSSQVRALNGWVPPFVCQAPQPLTKPAALLPIGLSGALTQAQAGAGAVWRPCEEKAGGGIPAVQVLALLPAGSQGAQYRVPDLQSGGRFKFPLGCWCDLWHSPCPLWTSWFYSLKNWSPQN